MAGLDIGVLLAQEIRARVDGWGPKLERASEGIRATVIGASQYTTQVSGSTIYVSPLEALPLRNVPVIAPAFALDGDDIDALVQVGTNLAAIEVCAEAERWLGKPVLAINAVTYWDALRRCGIDDAVHGCGSLLERS